MKSRVIPVIFVVGACAAGLAGARAGGRIETDLSGPGWTLWRDAQASWENDSLFLPPVNLERVPANPPTGGWDKLATGGQNVAVPGTAEEYLGDGSGPAAVVKGVTWWTRSLQIPAAAAGKKIRLCFDSVRLRAEVYVNRRLVAYDVVGNTPFEADLTGVVKPGEEAQLAVRVTNPGGNFDWKDIDPFHWGQYVIPASHGFGGITGGVRLLISDPVYVDDIYVQNTPAIRAVNVEATIKNTTGGKTCRDVVVLIRERTPAGRVVFQQRMAGVKLTPGDTPMTCAAVVPEAKIWDLQQPNLYECIVQLAAGADATDAAAQTFGFRWFAPEGIGTNAVLRLNGRRIFLRTAISWGFWPINGIFPSPALAEKQIRTARALGLNMLNFHRCIGNPIVFDKADKLGLLYFEEPGAYVSGQTDAFAQALCREKLLRMVRRDRSHPSLVIYNMINEQWDRWGADKDEALFTVHRRDLQAAHELDPSRVLLYTSAWAGKAADPENDKAKMHMRPFDAAVHMSGWFDYHRAGGPEVWKQEFYQGPTNHYGHTTNRREIVYWGEEGAISTPPRLGLIKRELDQAPRKGWDGQVYLDWYRAFDEFLDVHKLRGAFPTVDDLCQAMGAVSLEHQGRKIEDTRICDLNDGYAINGWEAEIVENHSGVVDCFRNPKADPQLIARYNAPLAIAVKVRAQIVQIPDRVTVDFYALNEKDIRGPHTLEVRAVAPAGREVLVRRFPVDLQGGEVFGQLLAEGVEIPVADQTGLFTIAARLLDKDGAERVAGRDQVLAVDWKKDQVTGRGAVYENGTAVRDFLKQQKGVDAPLFDDTQSRLDWLVVAKAAVAEPLPIAGDYLRDPSGEKQGLQATFYAGGDFAKPIHQRLDRQVDFSWAAGATPDPAVPLTDNYCVRWEGRILPPTDGEYSFELRYDDGARCWLDGQLVVNDFKTGNVRSRQFKRQLTANRPVAVKLELLQKAGGAEMHLLWQMPIKEKTTAGMVLERARRDGTTVILLDRADTWLNAIGRATGLAQGQAFKVWIYWRGGQYFVRQHPLFKDLPVDQALNWPYQAVVGGSRTGLELNGGELVAGAYNTWPFHLGTAVAVLPCGKGRIVVSTLDIAGQLASPEKPAHVARKLFCNYLEYAARP